ncbi:MAG: LytTR family DNA-binding domain-containing protein [Bacteroidales bacterium]|jgi:two-component system LytT family response regulator
MFENKRNIFIIIGFLIIWSIIISSLIRLYTKENLLVLFLINFLVFGLFSYLLLFFSNKIFSYQEEDSESKYEILREKEEKITTQEESQPKEFLERISVKTGQKLDVLIPNEIMFLQSNGDYVSIYSKDNVYLKEQTMKYFENNLSPKQFIRIHRTYIVNVDFIISINSYKKNQFIVKLKNNYELKASQSGYKLLKETLSI